MDERNAVAGEGALEALARQKLGDMMVNIYNEQSGASNLKAKQALDWQPTIPSWEVGFKRLYAAP